MNYKNVTFQIEWLDTLTFIKLGNEVSKYNKYTLIVNEVDFSYHYNRNEFKIDFDIKSQLKLAFQNKEKQIDILVTIL